VDKKIVGLGLCAGLGSGIAAFGLARWQVTPAIAAAIDYEHARSAAESVLSGEHLHEHEVFSRALQENVGAGLATVAFGIVIGALFAVAFSAVWLSLLRRHVAVSPRAAAGGLALSGFVSLCLVPFLVNPANPPGVGEHDTMSDRATSYLTVLVVSVIVAAAAFAMALRLVSKIGGFAAAVLGSVGYAVTLGVVAAIVPRYVETPAPLSDDLGRAVFPGFPADVLADFRMYSLLSQAVMWLIIGTVFAAVVPRVLHHRFAVTDRVASVAV
jgi:hypothetical protein